jgi:single-strand DNA-binding protein
MANDTPLTIIGNLTADPELRFTQSGVAVASFTIASTPRTFDKQRNEWVDGEALFMHCSIWRDAAENVAESLEKGARVIASGRLVQRSFTDRDGNQRTSIELQVDEIGPSLRYATARPQKIDRRANAGGGGGYSSGPANGAQGGYGAQQGGGYGQPQGSDPWAGGGNQGGYDDPPF